MELGEALLAVGDGARSESFTAFSRTLDVEWITRALTVTGTASVRRRKLPAERAVWLVIGMALLRDRSIEEVVHHLDLVLPAAGATPRRGRISRAAVMEARARLGCGALAVLGTETAQRWAGASADALRWRGLAVYGVDGTTLRTPDTPANEQTFGRALGGRSAGAYPQLRLVALMVLRSHLLADVAVGPFATGEQTLAQKLWAQLPEQSLTIVDKGFLNYRVFHQIQQGAARHWLCRAKRHLKWRVERALADGDELVALPLPRAALPARAIRYQRRGFRPQTLLTSLRDPVRFPAAEVIALYHERWELELGFDEIKTHTLERAATLRSKAPERVLQELWGLVIAYNLVRLEMCHVAARLGIAPTRISFRHALLLIRNLLVSAWLASPGVLPRRLHTLHDELALLVLPSRRDRHYPRAVKLKMSTYRKKPLPRRRPPPEPA